MTGKLKKTIRVNLAKNQKITDTNISQFTVIAICHTMNSRL